MSLCSFSTFFLKCLFISVFNQTRRLCSVKPMQNTLSVVSLNTLDVTRAGSFQLDGCFQHCTLDSNAAIKTLK